MIERPDIMWMRGGEGLLLYQAGYTIRWYYVHRPSFTLGWQTLDISSSGCAIPADSINILYLSNICPDGTIAT